MKVNTTLLPPNIFSKCKIKACQGILPLPCPLCISFMNYSEIIK